LAKTLITDEIGDGKKLRKRSNNPIMKKKEEKKEQEEEEEDDDDDRACWFYLANENEADASPFVPLE
jgi:hypothetical protein